MCFVPVLIFQSADLRTEVASLWLLNLTLLDTHPPGTKELEAEERADEETEMLYRQGVEGQ